MLVEPRKLGDVEARCSLVHIGNVEQGLHFVDREDFLVAMRPAQADEIVEQRVRQETIVTVLHDAHCAVPLGQLLAVRTEDHRQVREFRHRGA
jgi:hypothetical protein